MSPQGSEHEKGSERKRKEAHKEGSVVTHGSGEGRGRRAGKLLRSGGGGVGWVMPPLKVGGRCSGSVKTVAGALERLSG